ncbi:unnamed protein product [Ilex paraguariensis]|uniref:Uncharacterized protein n=1 Tax=Ilex paraguariensis TaxID=185542 RepID=A0ABC8R0F8_9AQUA
MMIPDGKNSFPELAGDEKETMAKKKGKHVLIADLEGTQNLIMGNGFKERQEQNGCDLPKASTDDQAQQNGDVRAPIILDDPSLVNKYAELDPLPSLIIDLPFSSKFVQHPTSKEMPNCQHPSLDSTFLVEHQYAFQEGTLIVMDDECGLHRTMEPPDRGFYSEDELTSRGDEGVVSDTQELESDAEQRQEL